MPMTIEDEPSPADLQQLDDRLTDWNIATTGLKDARLLAAFERDASGAIVGGAHGWTWGASCEIKTLWVDEAQRGCGLGRRLMAAVEKEARARGARQIVLSTHSFQAPDFYRRLGFQVVGSVLNHPAGHESYFLRKKL